MLKNEKINQQMKIFDSSWELFNLFKNLIKRVNEISRSQTMFAIYKIIKRNLKFYANNLSSKLTNLENDYS